MKSVKVSFIVPVYNVEHYIEDCIYSIINQTFNNIEIIIVDDGSTDSSGLLIDGFAKNDSRIKIVHKNNGGVSSARNLGLSISTGKYIVFVDGDDYIDPDYTDYFLKMIEKNDYDIAMNDKCYDLKNKMQNDYNFGVEYDSKKIIENIYIGKMGVAVWNKMYKANFLKKYAICFDEKIWYGEGMLFNIQCLANSKKVIVGNKLVYHQVFNPNSAMRKFNLESNYCGIKSLEIQRKFLGTDTALINAWNYHKRCFNMSILIGILKTNTKDKYKSEYHDCIKNLRKDFLVPLKVDITNKKKFYYIVTFLSPVLAAKISINREKKLLSKY